MTELIILIVLLLATIGFLGLMLRYSRKDAELAWCMALQFAQQADELQEAVDELT